MVESFQEIAFLTEMGQERDALASSRQGLEQWTMELYDKITELKGGYYSFYLSVLLSLLYLGLDTPSNVECTKEILIPLGAQEKKCSWVVIQAWKMSRG